MTNLIQLARLVHNMLPCFVILVFVVFRLSSSIFVQLKTTCQPAARRRLESNLFVGDFCAVEFFLELHVLLVEQILVEATTVAATVVVLALKNRVPDRRRDRVLAVERALNRNRRRRADAVRSNNSAQIVAEIVPVVEAARWRRIFPPDVSVSNRVVGALSSPPRELVDESRLLLKKTGS